MTNPNTADNGNTSNDSPRQPSPMLIGGSILWTLCLIGVFLCWYQWREKVLARKAEQAATESTEDDGRSTKQIKLVPQKDGTFEAQDARNDDVWDKDGIEDFSFSDTTGQTLTKKDLLGKPFIISFVFTLCRGPCPNVTLQMRELQDRLQDYDFNLVTLTVDPERDSIETLKQYGTNQGANFDHWKFLTGNQADIYGLIQRSFKMPVQETTGDDRKPGFEIIHSTNIMLVNSEGRVVGKFNAMKPEDMAKLRKEIKELAKLKVIKAANPPAKPEGEK